MIAFLGYGTYDGRSLMAPKKHALYRHAVVAYTAPTRSRGRTDPQMRGAVLRPTKPTTPGLPRLEQARTAHAPAIRVSGKIRARRRAIALSGD
ncbi:hypothetical protein MRX96_019385 [Rhipicephalus microplus]